MHPENDLEDDADYANLYRPAPRDADELADSEDPLTHRDRNRASTRQAVTYAIVAVATTLLFGLLLGVVFRFLAGPEQCEAFGGRLLCTPRLQTLWAVVVSLPPIGFLIGAMVIMVRKLRAYLRWRPWMGAFWVLLPFTMWVLTVTVQVGLAQRGAL
ncbi:hypothetical protein [Corynebacterium uterequi]|uniref:Uncharacterized protein n=1 Tax=Corynebacterium uterequi TaxID=1072256 RepID=A0A0G3HFT0_9CORY|nr:hypothetical protein [Corynebacterium uterequi]AKK12139.1 hypothetical protein CUTER_10890 [Corynebacterium uterequi]